MSVRFVFRPWDTWTDPETDVGERRSRYVFRAFHEQTIAELSDEIDRLGATEAVIQLALDETQIRRDGMPRVDAQPRHPGVIVSFESSFGPLRYATDAYETWQANLRAIRLALEALRAVDRYGVTRRGEQYTGFTALPAGDGAEPLIVEAAARFLSEHAGYGESGVLAILTNRDDQASAYRSAARKLHPDAGGDPEQFRRLQEARRVLEGRS